MKERLTTVMVEEDDSFHLTFKCSECDVRTNRTDWKFCAYCGAEIVRWDKCKSTVEHVPVIVYDNDLKPKRITVQVENRTLKTPIFVTVRDTPAK
jgi:hypothetical protein